MPGTVYSRANAFARFQYDRFHRNAYGYIFLPSNTFTGLRPPGFVIHGGGWRQPGMDESNERYPTLPMITRVDVADVLLDAGAIVILLEYPLGSGLDRQAETGPNATHFPQIWKVMGKAFQWVADQCGPGGILDGLGDASQMFAYANSAGASNTLFTQLVPDSWRAFPRARGTQVVRLNDPLFSSHRLKAIVVAGPPTDPCQDDPSRDGPVQAVRSPIIAAVANPRRYRPRVVLSGTLVESAPGALAVGNTLTLTSGTPGDRTGLVYSVTPGSPASIVLLVKKGLPTDFANADTFQKLGDAGTTFAVTSAPVITDRYGWLDLEQWKREMISPILLLDQMNSADLEAVENTPMLAFNTGNPSVCFRASDSLKSMIPNKYGADDSHDIMQLENRLLVDLGFDPAKFVFYWGDDAATATITTAHQVILTASNTNPIICTVAKETGIRSGDPIKIGQGTGNTAMNGVHIPTRLGPTSFSIPVDGTSGGAYAGGGVWAFHNAKGNYCVSSTILATFKAWLQSVGIGLA